MTPGLLDRLACPGCRARLRLDAVAAPGADGRLCCSGCGVTYPISGGVPRLLPATVRAEARQTAERFGWEWQRFAEIRPEYEDQFRGWIAPLGPQAFVGRRVLDAGCGKGRHLRLAAAWGAREVVGLELGPAADVAARNTADLENVDVIQGDLTCPPLVPGSFDLVYSIGVLHHLADPATGFRGLAPLLAPGGTLVAWVYGHEGNAAVLALLRPLRRLTRTASPMLVNALAGAMTVPLWAALAGLYRPARSRRWAGALLPYRSYLLDVATFPFREVHSIVFDQLMAPVAHYMRRGEVARCFEEAGLRLTGLRWHHENSWAAFGTAPGAMCK